MSLRNASIKETERLWFYSPVENIIGVAPLISDHSTQASEGRVAQLGECWQLLEAMVDDVQILEIYHR